jgi:hypothetical protein
VECAGDPAPQPDECVNASLLTLLGGLRAPALAERIA